jgi:signal transduction histidine kinase
VLLKKGSFVGRIVASGSLTHIPDLTALEGDHREDDWSTVVNAGFRTGLLVPLLKDNEIVGVITLGRKLVKPFTDKQISFFRDFAAQATIALVCTRRERQYREAQMALAHANRVATMGQLTASITHEVNQPIAGMVTNAEAALGWLGAEPPNLNQAREVLGHIVKDGIRAADVIHRIRALINKAPPRMARVDVN